MSLIYHLTSRLIDSPRTNLSVYSCCKSLEHFNYLNFLSFTNSDIIWFEFLITALITDIQSCFLTINRGTFLTWDSSTHTLPFLLQILNSIKNNQNALPLSCSSFKWPVRHPLEEKTYKPGYTFKSQSRRVVSCTLMKVKDLSSPREVVYTINIGTS